MDGGSGEISELPCTVVIDILRRIPIKTLVQCRHVCKSWNAMLSEIYFHKLYSTCTPTTLMIKIKGNILECLKNIYMIEANDDSSIKSRKLHIEEEESGFNRPNFEYQLGNSCNGLICIRKLTMCEPFAIWNPFMGQHVILPHPLSYSYYLVVSGFGFSPRDKLYKVIRIFYEKKTHAAAEIYDVGINSGSWRRIRDPPCALPARIPGFYVNNSLHWILDSVPNQLICCFDFNSEGFSFVPPPPIFCGGDENKKWHWSNLGVLAEHLSVCATDAKSFRADVEVWVMCEYGDPESWVKKLSIRDPAIEWWDRYRGILVIKYLKNGEVLLLCANRYLLVYDPRARNFVYKKVMELNSIAHVPSFIPL